MIGGVVLGLTVGSWFGWKVGKTWGRIDTMAELFRVFWR